MNSNTNFDKSLLTYLSIVAFIFYYFLSDTDSQVNVVDNVESISVTANSKLEKPKPVELPAKYIVRPEVNEVIDRSPASQVLESEEELSEIRIERDHELNRFGIEVGVSLEDTALYSEAAETDEVE